MEAKPFSKPRLGLFHLVLLLLALFAIRQFVHINSTEKIGFSEFKEYLKKGEVKNIIVHGDQIEGEYRQIKKGKKYFETFSVPLNLTELFDQYKVTYSSRGASTDLSHLLTIFFPFIVVVGLWIFFLRKGLKNLSNSGSPFMTIVKTRAKIYIEADTKVTFKDVAGVDEALEELREIIDFLKNTDKVKILGGKMPKGVLLVGAPGTGKTLIARALAGEAGVPFFSTNGAEFVEMFVGVGAARVRDLFEQAKKKSPCIIFIDELDALGKTRQLSPITGNDEKEQTLNQLLVEMDGFDTTSGIIILAATNRPELIDPALIRAGRFDRQVIIDRPDKKGREDILKIHAQRVKLSPMINLGDVAALTPGFTGADLANLVNEATLIATRKNSHEVSMEDFTEALERIMAGPEKKNRLLNPIERSIVAYHEIGHALVGFAFDQSEKIHKVSIIPHGIGSMGHTLQRPSEERYILTQRELENKMTVLLAGRAAENLIFSHLSTGATDDLLKATSIAREMITKFGMSQQLGFATYDDSADNFLNISQNFGRNSYSDATAKEIDENIKKVVWKAYQRAFQLLKNHLEILEEAAQLLIKNETLNEMQMNIFFTNIKVVNIF